MENSNKRILVICILTISVAISLVLVTLGLSFQSNQKNEKPWVLQVYGNNVALLNGDEIIEVYGTIMVDTLPDEDKRMLQSGLFFLTKEEAVTAIEDYDG